MSPMQNIRVNIFKKRQAEFAALIGVNQSTVSRWDNGVEPDRADLAAIRDAASREGIEWKDEWFFERPEDAA
ncbi:MAG TPA: hypothetical protein VFS39_00520 [Nitrospira sp.]|nr:hypothetical protein [Nitrospira sp.]